MGAEVIRELSISVTVETNHRIENYSTNVSDFAEMVDVVENIEREWAQ